MRSLIGLAGPAGSGKSTVADALTALGYQRAKFAGPLKDMLRALGLSEEEIEGALKESPCAALDGHTPRHAMQTLGVEWGRRHMGPDFWVRAAMRRIADLPRVVIDDVRFDNEVAAIRERGGVVINLTGRRDVTCANPAHASEHGGLAGVVNVDNSGPLILTMRDILHACRDVAPSRGSSEFPCERCHNTATGSTRDDRGFMRCNSCGYPAP